MPGPAFFSARLVCSGCFVSSENHGMLSAAISSGAKDSGITSAAGHDHRVLIHSAARRASGTLVSSTCGRCGSGCGGTIFRSSAQGSSYIG